MSTERTTSHGRRKSKVRRWKRISLLLFLLVLALSATVIWQMLRPAGTPAESLSALPQSAGAETEEAPTEYALSFSVPGQEPISFTVREGESFTPPEDPVIPGYTFLCWVDAEGKALEPGAHTVTESKGYAAQFAVAFRDERLADVHAPYLFLDADGMFHPNDALKKGELVQALYTLLEINGVGSGYFADVAQDDACYEAAATLKDLGLLEGIRLHPEDEVLYGELLNLLARLFPAAETEQSFSSVPADSPYYPAFCLAAEKGWLDDFSLSPYDIVPRKEAARLFNQLTGRSGMHHTDLSLTGTIADISSSDSYFSAIAEAVIPHSLRRDADEEVWTDSTPLPLQSEGFFFDGIAYRAIKADGSPAVGEQVGELFFDENGIVSTGDPELDVLVRRKLTELVDPASMSREEMLRIVYDFVLNDSFYLRAERYETGETGWETTEAYRMLSTGKGNCYSYAATFWALSRAIGYETVCYSGTVGTFHNPHGWAEITIDGVPYIFDPTMEYEQWYGPGTHTFERFYMKTYESVSGWNYTRE